MTRLSDTLIGADPALVHTTAQYPAGMRTFGPDGCEWIYVKASAAIAQYAVVAIDEDYLAAELTKALADSAHLPGFAQVAFAANEWGWVATRGSNIQAKVLTLCAADVELFTTATAGVLDDTSGSQTQLQGVVIVTAALSSTTIREIIATAPHFVLAT